MNTNNFIKKTLKELRKIKEIKAIVLAGSYATNTQRPDSDIDFGLIYSEKDLINIKDIEKVVQSLGAFSNSIISQIGEWGKWMNGGAWLIVENQRVDFIYRSLEFVEHTLDDCLQGRIQTDFYQQPAYGFYSYIYCAEVKFGKILYDPNNLVSRLKKKVDSYPLPLKEKIINTFLWDAQFSLSRAQKSVRRGEVYIVAGCLTRIVNDLVQVLYALNETYFFSEKKFYKDFPNFAIRPINFLENVDQILTLCNITRTGLNLSVNKTKIILNSLIGLSKNIYKPKYAKNLDDFVKSAK